MPKIQCDIAVIGSDIIGLCCGYALKKLGLSVEFIAIDESPRHWTAPWVGVHARKGKLDWAAILPRSETGTELPPLQLSTNQARLTLEPEERPHLAKWLRDTKTPGLDSKLCDYFSRKSPRPVSHQTPTLEQPSNSKVARIFKSQRGGHFSWSSLDTARTNFDFDGYPLKALLALAGLSESSGLPSFIEDDLESFLFGEIGPSPKSSQFINAIDTDLREQARRVRLEDLKVSSAFGMVSSLTLDSSTKLEAQTYLFNSSLKTYGSLSGDPIKAKSLESSSTFWTLELDAAESTWPNTGRALYSEEDNSSVCYLQWHRAGKVTKVELLTTEDANLEDVSQFARSFFNAPVERVNLPRVTDLPTLSELTEIKVASRFRNALYTGHELGPRYHFAAQCSVAEEILSSISLYREAPLTLSALPSVK